VITIVDSSVWIDYLVGRESRQVIWLDAHITQQRLGITDLILCEVLQGIQNQALFEQTRTALLRFELFPTGGQELALKATQNYRLLRARGITVRKTIDSLIATFCIENNLALLHNDRDFDGYEKFLGLQVVHPE
jgi:predicted nucleic acid-binding protein